MYMYVFVSGCIACVMYVYASICIISACMCVYELVYACIHMYVHVFDFLFCTRCKRERLPRPGPGALQCAVKKGIKGQQNLFDDSGTHTHVHIVICVRISH